MAFELIVQLENRPGMLAAAAGAIGKENVNIRAFAAVAGKFGEVRFLTDDADAAERALTDAGYKVRRAEVLAVPISNTPGEVAALSEKFARAGINIEGGYLASRAHGEGLDIVFEVSHIKAAWKAVN
jgi:hypothetical protein